MIRTLIIVATSAASYLAWVSLSGGLPVGCGPESGCDKVLHSRWAYWLGIPVSVPSLLIYMAMLSGTLGLRSQVDQGLQARCWQALVLGSVVLAGVATWFVALQALVIHSFCRLCLVAHCCGVTAAVILLCLAPFRSGAMAGRSIPICLAGLGVVAVLVTGQLLHEPKAFVVHSISGGTNRAPAVPLLISGSHSDSSGTNSSAALSVKPARPFSFYGGRFTLDVHDVPVIGSPTNPHVIVSLFDYTCHHCQIMHGRLVEAQQTFSNDLVIVSLPMPLDSRCNHTVKYTPRDHSNACDYARIGLAIWRADRTKHAEFDHWLFGYPKVPPVSNVLSHATQLTGAAAFEKAWQDSWIEQQLQFDVKVYELAYQAGRGDMPQMIVGTNAALGTFPQNELFRLIEANFGLKARR